MFKIDGKNSFVCDDAEFSGVKKIADKVCLDVERVTGKNPAPVVECPRSGCIETTFFYRGIYVQN